MPIAQEALDQFLDQAMPLLPQFKGAAPDQLKRLIYDATGLPLGDLKTQPRKHQLEGLAFALYLRQALLFFDVRMGKSKIALDWAQHLRRAKMVRER